MPITLSPYKHLIVHPQHVELQHILARWEFFADYLYPTLKIPLISYIVDRILPFLFVHIAYKSVKLTG